MYMYIYIYIYIYIYLYILLSRYNDVRLFFKIIKSTFFCCAAISVSSVYIYVCIYRVIT